MLAIKNNNYLTSLPGYSPQTLVMQGKRNKLLKPLALKKFTLSISSSLYIFRDSDTPPLPLLCQYFPAFRNSVMLSRMSLSFIYSDLLSYLPYRFHICPSGNGNHLHVVQSFLSFSHFPFRQRKPFTYRPVFPIVFTFPLQATETIYISSSLPCRFHISPSGDGNHLHIIQSSLSFSHFPFRQRKPFTYHPVFLIVFTFPLQATETIYMLFSLPYRFHISPSGNGNHLHVVQSSLSFSHFPFRQRKPFTYRPVFLIVFTFPLQATETIYISSSLPYRFHISPSGNGNHLHVVQSSLSFSHFLFLIIFTFPLLATETFYLSSNLSYHF